MPRRSLALVSVLVVVAGVIGVVAVSSGSDDTRAASSAAKGFTPKDIKGKWTGTWTNNTFGSTGDVISNVKVKGEKMTPITDFSGNVFGCDNPPQGSITLKPGDGKNKYNSDGFKIKAKSPAFGDDFQFTYKQKGNKVTASGSSPCDPSIHFTLTGTLTKTDFDADVNITSTPPSKSTVTATKD
jgi:hypothetical protein